MCSPPPLTTFQAVADNVRRLHHTSFEFASPYCLLADAWSTSGTATGTEWFAVIPFKVGMPPYLQILTNTSPLKGFQGVDITLFNGNLCGNSCVKRYSNGASASPPRRECRIHCFAYMESSLVLDFRKQEKMTVRASNSLKC